MSESRILSDCSSFTQIREQQGYYVDKTDWINELVNPVAHKVMLLTRPSGFGKTVGLSMLQAFFDITKDSRALFDGLTIANNEEVCASWMNRYPVIYLSLKDVHGSTFEEALEAISEMMSRVCLQCDYLSQGPIDEWYKEKLDLLKKRQTSPANLQRTLQMLTRALHQYHGQSVIVLVDDYDAPLEVAQRNGYYEKMLWFIHDFLGAALKSNPCLEFGVLTGLLPLAGVSDIGGFNNVVHCGFSRRRYGDKFGLTDAEVQALLNDVHLESLHSKVKEYFGGYCLCGESNIYCLKSVLSYVQALQEHSAINPKSHSGHWRANDVLKTVIEKANATRRNDIQTLLAGRPIEVRLQEQITHQSVDENDENLWTMLYLTGYLTQASEQYSDWETALVIPNQEVRVLFTDCIEAWLTEIPNRSDLSDLKDALWAKDSQTIQEALRLLLIRNFCLYERGEDFYRDFLIIVLKGCGLSVRSSLDDGGARVEVLAEDEKNDRTLMIDVTISERYAELEEKAQEAFHRVQEFVCEANTSEIIRYGMAFWKNQCRVSS